MYEQKDIDALQAAIAALKHAHKAVNWRVLPLVHRLDQLVDGLASDLGFLLELNAALKAEDESIK